MKPEENPALIGNGPDTLLCGECGAVVAKQVWYAQLLDLCFQCSGCGMVSETQGRTAHQIAGKAVYFPVGTYRLGSPLELPRALPLVGEPYPGAGPPPGCDVTDFTPDGTWH